MNTPADKPDLPGLKRSIETWAKCDPAAMAAQSEAAIFFAFQDLLSDVQTLARAVADERRKALYEAETLIRQRLDAATRCHAFTEGQYSEGQRDAYYVAALDIRALIDKEQTK